jgi:hypothetical protein
MKSGRATIHRPDAYGRRLLCGNEEIIYNKLAQITKRPDGELAHKCIEAKNESHDSFNNDHLCIPALRMQHG